MVDSDSGAVANVPAAHRHAMRPEDGADGARGRTRGMTAAAGWILALSALAAHAQQPGGLRLEPRAPDAAAPRLEYRLENEGTQTLRDIRFHGNDAAALQCEPRTASGAVFDGAALAPGDSVLCSLPAARGIGASGSGRVIVLATAPDGTPRKVEHGYVHGFGSGAPVIEPNGTIALQAQALVLIGAVHDDADGFFDFTAGETIDFTFTVVNTGEDTLDSIVVIDSFGTAIACPPGPLVADAALVCTSTYVIQPGDDAFFLENEADLAAQGASGAAVGAQDTIALIAGFTADLRMFKSPLLTGDGNGDGYVSVDDVVSYRFVIKNSNAEAMRLDALADPLVGAGAITCAPTTIDGQDFTGIPGGVLPSGDTVVCSADYTVTPADRDAGQVNNVATADGVSATTFSVVNTGASATVTVPSSTLVIEKTSLGGTGTFAFTTSNTEQSAIDITTTAAGVPESGAPVFIDALGTQDVLVGETDPAPDWVLMDASCTDGTDTWPLDGAVTIPAAAIGPGTAFQCSFVNATAPDVDIGKTLAAESGAIAGQAEAGELLTYEITLSNAGYAPHTDYDATDALDPNVVFVSASDSGVHDGQATGGQIDWTGLGVPAASDSGPGVRVLTVVVQVVDPIPDGVLAIGNVAYDPNEGPTDCDVTPLPPNCTITPTEPAVTTSKALVAESGAVAGQAEAGEQLTYAITLTNAGGSDATGVARVDQLDPNVSFVSADNGGTLVGSQVQWSALTVPANGSLVLTVVVQVVDPIPDGVTSIGNVAYDPNEGPTDCDVTPLPPNCTVTPTEPAVTTSKALVAESGVIAGEAEAGEQLTYAITLTNTGGADATGVARVDQLDPNVSFVSADNGGTLVGSQVQWSGLTVPSGGSLVLTVVVQVVDPIPDGVTSIGNVAYDPNEGPTDCDVSPLPPNCTVTPTEPAVSTAKALVGESGTLAGEAEAGEQLTYAITLTNTGGADATGVARVDQLDPNVTFVSADNGGTLVGSQVQWSGLTVPAGGSLVLTVVVQVADTIPDGVTSIGNVAYDPGEGPTDCGVTPRPPNCTSTPLAPPAALTIDKQVDRSTFMPGESGTYTVAVAVAGDGAPLGSGPVVLSDPMPAPLTISGAVTGTDWDCTASTADEAVCTYTGTYPVAPGAAVGGVITIAFEVPADAPSGGDIVNVATVTYGPGQSSADDDAVIALGVVPPQGALLVPTNAPWMLWLLGLLMFGVAAGTLRRHG